MISLFLSYWKNIVAILAILVGIFVIHHSGYQSGKKEVQIAWDAQKLVDAQAAAQAAAKTATIVVKSETGTQNANDTLKKTLDISKNYYNSHIVPNHISVVRMRDTTIGKANSGGVPQLSGNSEQFETANTNTVSSAEYEKLANDCLATTIMLNNAKDWAQDQSQIYNK